MSSEKKISILSIDGGGIKGLVSAQILYHFEEMLKNISNDPEARIADYFDFFAGTSTGGILTCLYLCPDKTGSKKSKFTAREVVNFYMDYGHKIFKPLKWHKAIESYDCSEFEDILDQYFKDLKLSELLKPCLITAYEIEKREAYFFTQKNAAFKKGRDFYVKEILRATTAAPHFFKHKKLKAVNDDKIYMMIDGGMAANNPAMCSNIEVLNKEKCRQENVFVLSVGNLLAKKSFSGEEVENILSSTLGLLISKNYFQIENELLLLEKITDCIDNIEKIDNKFSWIRLFINKNLTNLSNSFDYIKPLLKKYKIYKDISGYKSSYYKLINFAVLLINYIKENKNNLKQLMKHIKLKFNEIKIKIKNDKLKYLENQYKTNNCNMKYDQIESNKIINQDYIWSFFVDSIVEILMSANSETVHKQLYSIFNSINREMQYFRWEIDVSHHNDNQTILELDNASKKNLDRLIKISDEYVAKRKAEMENCAYWLIKKKIKFQPEEFKNEIVINEKCEKIQQYLSKEIIRKLQSKNNTIDRLNEFIKMPFLYEILVNKNNLNFKNNKLLTLVNLSKDFRNCEWIQMNYFQKIVIRRLNRHLIKNL